jgi:sRNA-binding regulator protein Hfq
MKRPARETDERALTLVDYLWGSLTWVFDRLSPLPLVISLQCAALLRVAASVGIYPLGNYGLFGQEPRHASSARGGARRYDHVRLGGVGVPTSSIGDVLMRSVIDRLKTYVEKNTKRGEKTFVTVTLTNGHKFEGYINPDYDELSVELVTNPGGETIYIAVSHIASIHRRPRRVPTDN